MNSDIYNGSSEGFSYLVDGYLDYSQEVIARRAIPDLRDGLKPVQRRILYSAKINDKKQLQKCAVFVADAMKLHPHGDSSVYGAFVLMNANNGSWNVPVFDGMGNLGKVYSSNPPAAYRYPKAKLNKNADDYFNEKDIFDLVQSEEGDGVEPTVLYPNYPTVLVNGTSGIAVSVGTKIPPFNFGDVVDLTLKYIKNGGLDPVKDIIYPDFPTGGVLVKTDSEVAKIMATGQGRLKVRANVEVNGNEIIVTEVPFGKTFEGIVKQIESAELKDVKSVMNLTGNDSNGKVVIACKSKRAVEWVLLELYRKGILQSIVASNILVINDGKPYILGVHGIIEEWVKFRRSVIVKKFTNELNNVNGELVTLDYFMRLIGNEEWRDNYVRFATKVSKKDAEGYLHTIFSDIPKDVCDWINGRAIGAFNNGGRYANRYSELQGYKEYCESMLNNPDSYISDELKGLKESKMGTYERKTFVSNTDYRFSKISDSDAVEDASPCVYTLTKEGFLYKNRDYGAVSAKDIMFQFRGQANSVLIGFDNYGRVLRLSGTDIEFTPIGSQGTYLPKVFEATFQDDYRVLYMGICDGSKRMLVYRDGYIGFFDTSEWVGKKVVRVVSKGVCTAVMDKLLEVYEECDIPQCLVMADDTTDNVRLCIVDPSTVPSRGRTSRAKIVGATDADIHYIKGMSFMDVYTYIKDPNRYVGKLIRISEDTFMGDPSELADGLYLDICKDLE